MMSIPRRRQLTTAPHQPDPHRLFGGPPMNANLKKVAVVATALSIFALSETLSAASEQLILAVAEGQVVAVGPCQDDPSLVCQTVELSGRSTVFGNLTARFSDRVNVGTGTYVGGGVLESRYGSIRTVATGQVGPTTVEGLVPFV